MVIPDHVAFIADGNRRWARSHSLPVADGHKAGEKAICNVIAKAKELGIKYVSFFVWSRENDQKRSPAEKQNISDLVEFVCTYDIKKLKEMGARLRILGEQPSFVGKHLADLVGKTVEDTKNNSGIDVGLYFGYGGRTELINVVKSCADDVKHGRIDIDDIDEHFVRSKFYAPDIPDPDILVRTSGEMRISNFLIWQIAFTELFFVDKYWPDFTGDDLVDILNQFEHRARRYGK